MHAKGRTPLVLAIFGRGDEEIVLNMIEGHILELNDECAYIAVIHS
jgi:hypothetical protein